MFFFCRFQKFDATGSKQPHLKVSGSKSIRFRPHRAGSTLVKPTFLLFGCIELFPARQTARRMYRLIETILHFLPPTRDIVGSMTTCYKQTYPVKIL